MLRLMPCLLLAALLNLASAGEWLVGWQNALQAAQAAGKPILVNFTGSDWCGWCIRLKQEVFDTPEFAAWAAERVVLLVVDFPMRQRLPEAQARENDELQRRFGIQGYPTIVLLAPDGRELGRLGYQHGGPKAWTAAAERILAAAR